MGSRVERRPHKLSVKFSGSPCSCVLGGGGSGGCSMLPHWVANGPPLLVAKPSTVGDAAGPGSLFTKTALGTLAFNAIDTVSPFQVKAPELAKIRGYLLKAIIHPLLLRLYCQKQMVNMPAHPRPMRDAQAKRAGLGKRKSQGCGWPGVNQERACRAPPPPGGAEEPHSSGSTEGRRAGNCVSIQ